MPAINPWAVREIIDAEERATLEQHQALADLQIDFKNKFRDRMVAMLHLSQVLVANWQ